MKERKKSNEKTNILLKWKTLKKLKNLKKI